VCPPFAMQPGICLVPEEEDCDDIPPVDGMEGHENVDMGALSDMDLTRPARSHEATAVETPVGLVDIGGLTHVVFTHFMERQAPDCLTPTVLTHSS